jgi:U-box domain
MSSDITISKSKAIGLLATPPTTTTITAAKVDDVDLEGDTVAIDLRKPTTTANTTMNLSEDDESSVAAASACHDKNRIGSDEEGQNPAFMVTAEDVEEGHVIDVDKCERQDSHTNDEHTILTIEQEGHESTIARILEEGSMSDTNLETHSTTPPLSSPNRLCLSRAFFCPITEQLFQDPVVAPDGITYERQAILQQRNGEKAPSKWQVNLTDDDDDDDDSVVVMVAAAVEKERHDDEEHLKKFYPNRALQQILAERQHLLLSAVDGGKEDDSIRSKLLRLQKNILDRNNIKLESFNSTTTTNAKTTTTSTTITKHRHLPEAYYCPITFALMHDPVIDPDGNTFERRSIQLWIRAHHTSPLSRRPLEESQLYNNTALWQIMQDEARCSSSDDAASIHPSIQKWRDEPTPEPLPPMDVVVSFANSNIILEDRAAELEAIRQQEIFQTKVWCIFSVGVLILMVYLTPSSGIVLAMIYIAFVCCYTNIPDESGRRAMNRLLPPPPPSSPPPLP